MRSEPFTDWFSVRSYLVTLSAEHEFMNDDVIRFPFMYREREMEIFVRHMVHELGSSWIYVGSRLAPSPGLDLETLIRRDRPGPVGTLCLAMEYLCVGHNLPVKGLRADHFDWTLDALCAATDYYRAILGERSRGDLSALAHLIE